MINSILKKHFGKEEEEVPQQPKRQMMIPSPELLEKERVARENFIKKAKAKMLGKAICKNDGCQNLRASGSSRCLECSMIHKHEK